VTSVFQSCNLVWIAMKKICFWISCVLFIFSSFDSVLRDLNHDFWFHFWQLMFIACKDFFYPVLAHQIQFSRCEPCAPIRFFRSAVLSILVLGAATVSQGVSRFHSCIIQVPASVFTPDSYSCASLCHLGSCFGLAVWVLHNKM
jgi:hypothetical protein